MERNISQIAGKMRTYIALAFLMGYASIGLVQQAFAFGWEAAQRDPEGISLTITGRAIYSDGIEIRLTEAGGDITASQRHLMPGAGCDFETNSSPYTNSGFSFVAKLKPRRPYILSVSSTAFNAMDLAFKIEQMWTALTVDGRNSQPKSYALLIDGSYYPNDVLPIKNPLLTQYGSNCVSYSNTWTISLEQRLPANYMQEDGSDDPKPAPGEGKWAELGASKILDPKVGDLRWSVSLGRLKDGTAAGRLGIAVRSPVASGASNIFHMAASQVVRDQVQIVYQNSSSTTMRQVKAYQCFVDVAESSGKTELRFYHSDQIGTEKDVNGWYTNFSGGPFVVWTLSNPVINPGTNILDIIEARNGVFSTNGISLNTNSSSWATWRLKSGSGSEQRVESRDVQITNINSQPYRVDVVDVRYTGDSKAVYRCTEKYRNFPWGVEFVENRVDPDCNPATDNDLVSTVSFNTNESDSVLYGKPDILTYPDGYWQRYVYDTYGTLEYVLLPERSSVTDPTLATTNNSIVKGFWGSESVFFYPGTWSQVSDWRCFKATVFNTIPASGGMFESLTGGYNSTTYIDYPVLVGNRTLSPNESWGFGYWGHNFWEMDGENPNKISYYQAGTYDAASQMFTAASGSEATNFVGQPDYRQCTIYSASYIDDGTGMAVEKVDGQQLYPSGLFLFPYRCSSEAFIYHNGSLAQREMYVFTGRAAPFELVKKWVYQNDSLGHATNITVIDAATGGSRVIYSCDYRGTNSCDGNLLFSEIDETGIKKYYGYDSLKRLAYTRKEGAAGTCDIVVTNKYDAYGRILSQVTSAGDLSICKSTIFDGAGNPLSVTDTNGLTTTYKYDFGGRKVTMTNYDNTTQISENYIDRRLKSVTGTGVVNEYHDWNYVWSGVDESLMFYTPYFHQIQYGATNSLRKESFGIDFVDRVVRHEKPDLNGNSIIDLYEFIFRDGPVKKPAAVVHSKAGEWGREILAEIYSYGQDGLMNGYEIVPTSSYEPRWAANGERKRTIDTHFTEIGGNWFNAITNYIYLSDGDETPTIQSVRLERLSGFSDANTMLDITEWDADTNSVQTITRVNRDAKQVTMTTVSSKSTLVATNITINGLLKSESTLSVAQPTFYFYDALERPQRTQNPQGFSLSVGYNQYGQLTNSIDYSGLSTDYTYYPQGSQGAGKVKSVTVNGKNTYHSYTQRGELQRTWGDVPYPEERVYNNFGDLTELHTFRSGTNWNGAVWPSGSYDLTKWVYDDASGFLKSKTDAASKTVSYTYWGDRLASRTSRNITVGYDYNAYGDLTMVTSNSSLVVVRYNSFNRVGQPREIVDDTGTSQLGYDYACRLTSVTGTQGLFSGITVSNHFGASGRDSLQLLGGSASLRQTFGFDTYGRLQTISQPGVLNGLCATYTYMPNSDLLQSATDQNGTSTALTTTREWDYGTRLRSIQNAVGSLPVTSGRYFYDAFARRKQAVLEDGSVWNYGYNDRNELTSANRTWSYYAGATPVAGQQYAFTYDNIGNRLSAASGGDTNGLNLHTNGYKINNLNQYTTITNPGRCDVIGAALATNGVTVNGTNADRKGEYYHSEISVSNTYSLWQNVTVTSGTATKSGGLAFPGNQEGLLYDDDGNLLLDGVWAYEWDWQNRLASITMRPITASSNHLVQLRFTYDYLGRRAQKIVSTNSAGTWFPCSTNRYLYALASDGNPASGWNVLAVLDGNNNLVQSFLWGSDLSGTMEGAGGIGGLIAVSQYANNQVTNANFAAYDGNGNVTALVRATDKATSARYEYSPFGQLLRATGPMATANPFRFSTKFTDDETGLVCYPSRYYSPTLGRWISRDPAEEDGGNNLYHFCQNRAIQLVDPNGAAAVEYDGNGLHVNVDRRGGNSSLAYAFDIAEDGSVNLVQKGKHYFDETEATGHWNKFRQKKDTVQKVLNVLNEAEDVYKAAKPTINSLKEWAKAGADLGRKTTVALAGVGTISYLAGNSARAADTFDSYTRNRISGNDAYADLDAIDFAIMTQEATGNWFYGYATLDVLLTP